MDLAVKKFKFINLRDPFFKSLINDYEEFPHWFVRKGEENAYIFEDADGVNGFLYLKPENGPITDVKPPLSNKRRLKVGTMKINARGTKLGERFLKKIFDHALHHQVEEIYVTVFSHHEILIALFLKYGFVHTANKETPNGTECVYVKSLTSLGESLVKSYPLIETTNARFFLLSINPEWHTRLLPDSILNNESNSIIEDVSHTNSIHKVYLAAMSGLEILRPGDVLLIYRTSDNKGPAEYRSVATSVGVVEEYRSIHSFESREHFLRYCRPYSVFTDKELESFWSRKKYPHVFRFTYNAALKRRITRGTLISDHGLNREEYWGFMQITASQFDSIIQAGQLDESIIIN